jgi:hypothetical protein
MQQSMHTGNGCAANGNMHSGMRSRAIMGSSPHTDTTAVGTGGDWRANPSYRGQTGPGTTGN